PPPSATATAPQPPPAAAPKRETREPPQAAPPRHKKPTPPPRATCRSRRRARLASARGLWRRRLRPHVVIEPLAVAARVRPRDQHLLERAGEAQRPEVDDLE